MFYQNHYMKKNSLNTWENIKIIKQNNIKSGRRQKTAFTIPPFLFLSQGAVQLTHPKIVSGFCFCFLMSGKVLVSELSLDQPSGKLVPPLWPMKWNSSAKSICPWPRLRKGLWKLQTISYYSCHCRANIVAVTCGGTVVWRPSALYVKCWSENPGIAWIVNKVA